MANPLRFSTQFTDEETGLIYYGYRYYSPSLGRWINRDPIEEQGGLNLYSFCADNPLTVIDTDGRENLISTLSANSIRSFWVWGGAVVVFEASTKDTSYTKAW